MDARRADPLRVRRADLQLVKRAFPTAGTNTCRDWLRQTHHKDPRSGRAQPRYDPGQGHGPGQGPGELSGTVFLCVHHGTETHCLLKVTTADSESQFRGGHTETLFHSARLSSVVDTQKHCSTQLVSVPWWTHRNTVPLSSSQFRGGHTETLFHSARGTGVTSEGRRADKQRYLEESQRRVQHQQWLQQPQQYQKLVQSVETTTSSFSPW